MTQVLNTELESWLRTKYLAGCSMKNGGVDCVRFASAIWDFLYGTESEVQRLSPATALHDREAAFSTIRQMVGFWPNKIYRGNILQPADIVVFRVGNNPGHVGVVGTTELSLYHANDALMKVSKTTVNTFQNVLRVYRPLEIERWIDVHPCIHRN